MDRRGAAASDAYEGPHALRALLVDRAREGVLSGTRLSAEHDGRVARAELRDRIADPLEAGALEPDDRSFAEAAVELFTQDAALALRAGKLLRARVGGDASLDAEAEIVGVPRLEHVFVDVAATDRIEQELAIGICGEEDAPHVGPAFRHFGEQIDAGHLRHAMIGHDHSDLVALEDRERLFAGLRREDREVFVKDADEEIDVGSLVVDDEHGGRVRHRPARIVHASAVPQTRVGTPAGSPPKPS